MRDNVIPLSGRVGVPGKEPGRALRKRELLERVQAERDAIQHDYDILHQSNQVLRGVLQGLCLVHGTQSLSLEFLETSCLHPSISIRQMGAFLVISVPSEAPQSATEDDSATKDA